MTNKLMSKTFLWMCVGLLVTFVTGFFVSTNKVMIANIFEGPMVIVLGILEIVLVIVLSARIRKMSANVARIVFLFYSFISGLTLSSIFVVYQLQSIIYVFIITSLVFLVFGLIGYYTNIDLTKLGTYLMMAVLAVVICFIINLFIGSDAFDLGLSIISVLIFLGFTAYDVQKIKLLGELGYIPEDALSIIGALNLYLDYINIFIDLLRIFGDAKD